MSTPTHPWSLSPQEALALQKQLAGQVIRVGQLGAVTTIAGVDASYRREMARAAILTGKVLLILGALDSLAILEF